MGQAVTVGMEFTTEVVNVDGTSVPPTVMIANATAGQVAQIEFNVTVDLATFQPFDGTMNASYCLLYTSPSPRDGLLSRMPSSA